MDYQIGLELALKITSLIVSFFVIIQMFWIRDNYIRNILIFLMLGFGIIVFLYPLFNIIFQWKVYSSIETFQSEISNGVIGMRVSSLILSWKIFQRAVKELSTAIEHESVLKPKFEYVEFKKLNTNVEPYKINTIDYFQFGFYLQILIALWVFVINEKTSIEIQILSWGLFFIIDDWNIISSYLHQLKGRILFFQQIKVWSFNLLLAILFILIIEKNYNIEWFWGCLVVMILILGFRIRSEQSLILRSCKLVSLMPKLFIRKLRLVFKN
jgi:hypothetical protein